MCVCVCVCVCTDVSVHSILHTTVLQDTRLQVAYSDAMKYSILLRDLDGKAQVGCFWLQESMLHTLFKEISCILLFAGLMNVKMKSSWAYPTEGAVLHC